MKNIFTKIAGGACIALCLLAMPVSAEPVQTQLTADTMDYDMESCEFQARGHVTLRREGIRMTAANGDANTKTQNARMWGNVKFDGERGGEKLDGTCGELLADFAAAHTTYTMIGGVDVLFGTRHLVSDKAKLEGNEFSAYTVSEFSDSARRLRLTCDVIRGDYDSQGLDHFKAHGRVHLYQINDRNKTTDIRCRDLVYDRVKGALTATGNARAVQDGRRITADRLVYFPDSGKLEAKGKPKITVDVKSVPRPARKNNSKKGVKK